MRLCVMSVACGPSISRGVGENVVVGVGEVLKAKGYLQNFDLPFPMYKGIFLDLKCDIKTSSHNTSHLHPSSASGVPS